MYTEKHIIKNKFNTHAVSRIIPVYEFSGDRCSSVPTTGYINSEATVVCGDPEWNEKFSSYSVTGASLTGNNYKFTGTDVEVKANFETAKNLTLEEQTTSDIVSGFIGDTVTLGNTPDWNEKFSSYGITGATLTGNKFKFVGEDVTAAAEFETAKNFNGTRCNSTPNSGFIGDTAVLNYDTPEWNEKFSSYTIENAELTGNDFTFTGENVEATANYETAKELSLTTDGHGKIESTKNSGFIGDTATLSNTASAGYTFTGYTTTGAELTGSNFTFTGENITANAGFSANVYNVTLQNDGHGTIAATKTTGNIGDTITLSNTPAAHYTFSAYTITGAVLTGSQFKIDTQNTTAKGWFKEDPKYTLTLQTDGHGKISANKTTGYQGDTVTLSNTASAYYGFKNYTVTGATINGSTLTFGAQNCTAKANYSAIPKTWTATGVFGPAHANARSDWMILSSLYFNGVAASSDVFKYATDNTVRTGTGNGWTDSVGVTGYIFKPNAVFKNLTYKLNCTGRSVYDTIGSWYIFDWAGLGHQGSVGSYGGTGSNSCTGTYANYTAGTDTWNPMPQIKVSWTSLSAYSCTFSATGVLV